MGYVYLVRKLRLPVILLQDIVILGAGCKFLCNPSLLAVGNETFTVRYFVTDLPTYVNISVKKP
jgi:hypothetical protein